MIIKDMLRDAQPAEKTIDLCLRGDLVSAYETLDAKRQQLPRNTSLGGSSDAKRIAAEMDELRTQVAAATIPFRVRALPRRDFQALLDKHPPRRDGNEIDPRDAQVGFNRDTLFDVLNRACVVDPELDDEDWTLLLDEKLNDGQFQHLAYIALSLNRREVDIPFSRDDSPTTPD